MDANVRRRPGHHIRSVPHPGDGFVRMSPGSRRYGPVRVADQIWSFVVQLYDVPSS
jgi:hypothetical protein